MESQPGSQRVPHAAVAVADTVLLSPGFCKGKVGGGKMGVLLGLIRNTSPIFFLSLHLVESYSS